MISALGLNINKDLNSNKSSIQVQHTPKGSTMSDLPPRQKSQRTNVKSRYSTASIVKSASGPVETYAGLNDITDGFEALPLDVIRYFTLLKEIDAKCVSIVPQLTRKIKDFKRFNEESNIEKKKGLIQEVIKLLKDLMPCLEEKMHVATITADKTIHHVNRINDDFELILKREIPEKIKFGPSHEPAIIDNSKAPENKSAQSQRSESRREALAAKKAAAHSNSSEDDKKSKRSDKESTPTAATKKRKTNSSTSTNTSGIASAAAANNNNTHPTITEEPAVSRPGTPSNSKRRTTAKRSKPPAWHPDDDAGSNSAVSGINSGSQQRKPSTSEPLYCYCNQVSYGEMVGCDGEDCKREWFHLPCIGLTTLPKGKWYCDECSTKLKKAKKN